jgi:hypothetical protein
MHLAEPEERQRLMESSRVDPRIHALLTDHLEDYVRLFKWLDFHTVYQAGLLSIQGPSNVQFAFPFESLLAITGLLTRLERFAGFQTLIEGFRNPTQVKATIFEVQVAAWCESRKVCRSIGTRNGDGDPKRGRGPETGTGLDFTDPTRGVGVGPPARAIRSPAPRRSRSGPGPPTRVRRARGRRADGVRPRPGRPSGPSSRPPCARPASFVSGPGQTGRGRCGGRRG